MCNMHPLHPVCLGISHMICVLYVSEALMSSDYVSKHDTLLSHQVVVLNLNRKL